MLSFFINNGATILISLLLLTLVVFVVRGMIKGSKTGGCSGCSGCSHGGSCGGCSHGKGTAAGKRPHSA